MAESSSKRGPEDLQLQSSERKHRKGESNA